MDRTISIEDRIRRAEEIYNRKRQDSDVRVRIRPSNVNKNEKIKFLLFRKMILQISICIVIYLILYLIKNSNYIFSENVIKKTKEYLSYDINFNGIYNSITSYFNDNIKPIIEKNNSNDDNNINQNDEINSTNENNETERINNVEENNQVESKEASEVKLNGIGGGEDEEVNGENKNEVTNVVDIKEEVSSTSVENETKVVTELSQMEIDANDIKANYNLILPLVGTITSRYGPRTPTAIVSANHAGIDIAVNEGTVFVAAMEGKVITASGDGSYGNHIFIQNGDVVTVYAHCKTLYVKEGDMIVQGQKLGEVGQTGNATGPHLHFEIRKGGRTINPEYILSFG